MAQFNNPEALVVQAKASLSSQREPFLHFCLEEGVGALVPLEYSAEVLNIPRKDIVPLFFMPGWVSGVYNLRGEILWIIDLAHLLGLAPCYRPGTGLDFTVVVLQVSEGTPASERTHRLGCIIHDLESIEYCSFYDFSDAHPLAMSHLISPIFLQGYWNKSETEALAVLDIKSIIQSISQIS